MARSGVFFTDEEFNEYFSIMNSKDQNKLSVKEILKNLDELKKTNLECEDEKKFNAFM